MNSDDLRALADALQPMAAAPCFDGIDIERAAAYLRAQADAQPVAWIAHNLTTGHVKWTTDRCRARGWTRSVNLRVKPLYAHPAPAVPQAEPCIGNDPICPCQDGDACHYKDAADGTKAWPAPQAEPVSDPRPCTCHPDDSPPVPCARKYALSECRAASGEPTEAQIEAATVALYSYFGDEQSRLFLKSVADDVLRSALAAKDE